MYSQYVGKELVEFTRKSFPLPHKREDTYIKRVLEWYIKRVLEWLPLEGKMSGVSSGNIGL